MAFSVDISRHTDHHVLHVVGDVDVYTAAALSNSLHGILNSGVAVVVIDLSRCEYFDSEGVKALIRARLAIGDDRRLIIRGARRGVARVFRVAGLDGFLDVVSDPTD